MSVNLRLDLRLRTLSTASLAFNFRFQALHSLQPLRLATYNGSLKAP